MIVALVALTVIVGAASATGWYAYLEIRYGQQVHPDASLASGFALIFGWALIAFFTAVAVVVEVAL